MSVRHSRFLLIFAGVVLLFQLVGCSYRDFAAGIEPDELEGVWEIGESYGEARLTLEGDGTFQASNWPRNLMCTGVAADLSEIHWGEVVEFRGRWGVSGPDYALFFRSDDQVCTEPAWYTDVWKSADGLEMKVFLSGADSPDVARDDEVLWIMKLD